MSAADGSVEGSDWLVDGSQPNPSPAKPQVNPTLSVGDDGLTGSSTRARRENQSSTTAKSSTTTADPVAALDHDTTRHLPPGTETVDLTSENAGDGLRDESVRPRLFWPANPAWADRWQTKIDNAAPEESADAAWRALLSAVRRSGNVEARNRLYDELTDWLVRSVNSQATGTPIPELDAQPLPRSEATRPVTRKPTIIGHTLEGKPIWHDPEEFDRLMAEDD